MDTNTIESLAYYNKEELVIAPFTKELLTAKYRSWFYDPEVTEHNSHGLFPYTEEQAEAFYKLITEGSDKEIVFAVFVKYFLNGQYTLVHVGNAGIQRINYFNRSAELTWVIGDKEYWGKGIATKVGKFLINHCFNHLNLNRVWTGTSETNIGMQRVCSKLGMNREGTLKEGMYLNGVYVDIFIYGLLSTDNVHLIDSTHVKEDTLEEIQQIRKGNNDLWMSLLRLSLEADPEKAKGILQNIIDNDQKITNKMQTIIGENK